MKRFYNVSHNHQTIVIPIRSGLNILSYRTCWCSFVVFGVRWAAILSPDVRMAKRGVIWGRRVTARSPRHRWDHYHCNVSYGRPSFVVVPFHRMPTKHYNMERIAIIISSCSEYARHRGLGHCDASRVVAMANCSDIGTDKGNNLAWPFWRSWTWIPIISIDFRVQQREI